MVKKKPARASFKDQREMKTGRMGPRMVVTMPVMINPANNNAVRKRALVLGLVKEAASSQDGR
jgi:hypothetical protein